MDLASSLPSQPHSPSTFSKDAQTQGNSANLSPASLAAVQQSTASSEGSTKNLTGTTTTQVDTIQHASDIPPPDLDQNAVPENSTLFEQAEPLNAEWQVMKIQLENLQSKIKSLEMRSKPTEVQSKVDESGAASEKKSSAKFSDEPATEIKKEAVNQQPILTVAASQDEKHTDSSEPQIRPVPEVHLVDWIGFKNVCLESQKVYAVEVLMGPAKFYWQRHSEEKARKRQFGNDVAINSSSTDRSYELTTEQLRKAQKEVPERIRVNSRHVLSILSDIMSEELDLKPRVFLRPYKPLVLFETEIRQWLRDLETKWGGDCEKKHEKAPQNVTLTESSEAKQVSLDMNETMDAGNAIGAMQPSAMTDTSKDRSPAAKTEEEGNFSDSLEALQHLRCLVKFMDDYLTPVVERCRSPTAKKIHFRDLWYLFQPGHEIVYSQDLDSVEQGRATASSSSALLSPRNTKRGQQTMWKVLQVTQGRPVLATSAVVRGGSEKLRTPDQKMTPLKLLCYMIGFDGTKFGPIHHVFDISPFEGEKDIHALEVVPAWAIDNEKALRERLRLRGLKFMTCTSPSHQVYTGPTLTHHPGGIICKLVKRTENIDGNVIVDFREATRSNKEWVLHLEIPEELGGVGLETIEDFPVSVWKDVERKILDSVRDDWIYEDNLSDAPFMEDFISRDRFLSAFKNRLSDDQVDGSNFTDSELILLPDRVCAFNLHRRCFAIINLQGLSPVGVRTEGWSDLKLPRGHKKMVQAQVEIHFKEKKIRDTHVDRHDDYDLVRGKGQGLIILLHGAPGVGKTSTAECVAESLQKPLYPITCGDLGVSAKEVEETLEETFAKAEAWDCVLLLDEADVFLAQRTRTDLKRNAIVSVFLRVLEYYKGILFLTTNRVGAFDEAFKSRIHMHLYYPTLNKDQTRSIWRMNLDRTIKRKRDMMTFDETGIIEYAEQHFDYHKKRNTRWNGRQIHNAFRTAAALAEYEVQEAKEKQTRTAGSARNIGDDPPIRARLEVEHFKIVSEASHLFDSYITETVGGTDAERALNDRDRADNFKWTSVREQDFYQPQQPYQSGQYSFPQQQPEFSRTEFEPFQHYQHLRRLDHQNVLPSGGQLRPPQSWPRPAGEDLNEMYAPNIDTRPPWASSLSQRQPEVSPRLPGVHTGLGAGASSSTRASSKALLDPDDGY